MSKQKHIVNPLATCPYCNHKHELALGINHDQKPVPGDYSICIECGGVLVFNESMQTTKPTIAQLEDAYKIPDLVKTQRIIIAERNRLNQ